MFLVIEPLNKSSHIKKRMSNAEPQDKFLLAPGIALLGIKMTFGIGEEIHGEGEPAEMVYRVIKGAVREFNIRYDGRRQVEGFHLAGDMFGLDAGLTNLASAEATVDGTVVVAIWRSSLDEIASRETSVAHHILHLMSSEWARSRYHALLLGRKNAMERIAGFLLDIEHRQGRTGSVCLPMGRNDIADYLGLTIETVSRSFTQLERSHVIDMITTRHLRLLRRKDLMQLVA